jgi:hypothetical protein
MNFLYESHVLFMNGKLGGAVGFFFMGIHNYKIVNLKNWDKFVKSQPLIMVPPHRQVGKEITIG